MDDKTLPQFVRMEIITSVAHKATHHSKYFSYHKNTICKSSHNESQISGVI